MSDDPATWRTLPDLAPRMLCKGGPLNGLTFHALIRPEVEDSDRQYHRVEERGGAFWQW